MDHDRVNFSSSSMSCGVGELSRLSDEVEEVLFAIATHMYHPARGSPKAFLCFSNIQDRETNGHRLADKVGQMGFGPVIQTDKADNPHTGNVICVWIWQVHHERFREWYKGMRIGKLKK